MTMLFCWKKNLTVQLQLKPLNDSVLCNFDWIFFSVTHSIEPPMDTVSFMNQKMFQNPVELAKVCDHNAAIFSCN